MYARQELVELGERVADEGVYRHERELQDLAQAVATRSPGAALVLGDRRRQRCCASVPLPSRPTSS